MEIFRNIQKEPWFLKINPNGRIPAITDTLPTGENIRVFESGSILHYLADRYDTEYKISYPLGTPEHYETISWLYFQNAGLGPMQGQANHFRRYAAEKVPYGLNRYTAETNRLYAVLEQHLKQSGRPFIVGDHVTIADFSTIGWVMYADWAGIDIDQYPILKQWQERVYNIPGVPSGFEIPKPLKLLQMSPAERNEYSAKVGNWISAVQNNSKDAN